jgi:acyl-CoA thioester hydrolase
MNPKLQNNEIFIEPRNEEVDSMKVVHHSKYWDWFEECRFKWLRKVLGVSSVDFKNMKYYLPIIDCECSYKKPIFWDSKVIISTKLKLTETQFYDFRYEIRLSNQPKVLLTTGRTKHVVIDHNYKLMIKKPDLLTKKMNEIIAEMPFAFIE